MKRLFALSLLCLFAAAPMLAADTVAPASCTFTNVRAEAVASVAAGTLYRGATLNLTNCVACTTNAATIQGLDSVTVAVAVGNSTTNIEYSATVQSAAAGSWHCTVAVPDLASFFIQVKITDSLTNSYIYANKVFTAETSLF